MVVFDLLAAYSCDALSMPGNIRRKSPSSNGPFFPRPPPVKAGKGLRRDSQSKTGQNEVVDEGCSEYSPLFPPPSRSDRRRRHNGNPPQVRHKTDKKEILRNRHFRKSAHCLKARSAHKERLISIGKSQVPGADICGKLDPSHERSMQVRLKAKGSQNDSPVHQRFKDLRDVVFGQARIRMEKKKNTSLCLSCPPILL
jgi:hypothetical protein